MQTSIKERIVINKDKLESKILRTLYDFTKASPQGTITTGMLNLIIKPDCDMNTFIAFLEEMQERDLILGIPKGKTKRWKLD